MERLSAEGVFFHRSCFQCDHCSDTLRLAAYAYDPHGGQSLSHRTQLGFCRFWFSWFDKVQLKTTQK